MSRQNDRNNRGRKKADDTVMNDAIRANELRVLGDDGEQFGIISKSEAMNIADELFQSLSKNNDIISTIESKGHSFIEYIDERIKEIE